MKPFTYVMSSFVAWGLLSACSGPQAQLKAPSSKQEAQSRFLIKGTESDTAAVLAASTASRTISAQHNIYEVSGLSYYDIKDIAPAIHAEQNDYIPAQRLKIKPNPYKPFKTVNTGLTEDMALIFEEEPSEEPQNNNIPPAQELPPALQGCDVNVAMQPVPNIGITNDVLQSSNTMELGETVIFTGQGSLPSPGVEGEVTIQWDIITPTGSKITSGLRVGKTFELKPDMMGAYRIIMVARDNINACALIQGQFLVSYNPDFEYPEENEEKPMIDDLSVFSHLERVQAQQAWDKATGQGVTVAVLDSGLHYNHRGIKFNLAYNKKEQNGQELADDDDNHFNDDILGWDFVNNDNMPFDDEGHGSHVAGLVASHIYGLAKNAQVLPIKVLSAAGSGDVGSIIAGLYYAIDNDAQIINASLGGFQSQTQLFMDALEYAHSKNVAFIAASGNSTLDLSLKENEIYPGELDVPNVVNVAAVGVDQNLASYSNFGFDETDVAAPGGDAGGPIYSLATLNPHGVNFIGLAGTSMAAPIVAGVAALLVEVHPEITPEEIRQILMTSGTSYDELKDHVASGKILDAFEAVLKAQELAELQQGSLIATAQSF